MFRRAKEMGQAAYTRQTMIGPITLIETDGALSEARFNTECPPNAEVLETPLLASAFLELEQYFAGKRECFTIPLHPVGTPFQLKCWEMLLSIPYGERCTYGDEAAAIGNPKACRAVGGANHCNPLPIFIPCHRVVGKNGTLVGYGGGLAIQKKLLELENKSKG
ncbi:MAG: methylated-DNA--[protein]-cysteine S-methyltransferase [Clostridia bacterium]